VTAWRHCPWHIQVEQQTQKYIRKLQKSEHISVASTREPSVTKWHTAVHDQVSWASTLRSSFLSKNVIWRRMWRYGIFLCKYVWQWRISEWRCCISPIIQGRSSVITEKQFASSFLTISPGSIHWHIFKTEGEITGENTPLKAHKCQ